MINNNIVLDWVTQNPSRKIQKFPLKIQTFLKEFPKYTQKYENLLKKYTKISRLCNKTFKIKIKKCWIDRHSKEFSLIKVITFNMRINLMIIQLAKPTNRNAENDQNKIDWVFFQSGAILSSSQSRSHQNIRQWA